MRRYKSLWNQLKSATANLQITAPRKTHSRIVKGLRKESALDQGFRFKCVEDNKSFVITSSQVDDLLIVYIEYRNTIPETFILSPSRLKRREGWRSKYIDKHPTDKDKEGWNE